MKIALCHSSVLPRRGGCETYIASLSRRLVADGHEVLLLASEWDAEALPSRLQVRKIELPSLPRFLRPWWFSRACVEVIQESGVDVSIGFDKIHGIDIYYPQGGMYDASVALSLGKHRSRLLRSLLLSLKWFEPAHVSYLLLERAQYRQPRSMIIAISDMVRRHLHERGYTNADIHRVPIAPPRERLLEENRASRRTAFRQRWNILDDRPVAIFVGLNHRLKGLEPLLHSLARPECASIELVVAGAPSNWQFRRLISSLGLEPRVRFVGYCADMGEAYFASDLLVHPTFYDPCSNVVLEALACGLPVITSRHNGAGELLTPTGIEGVCREGFVIPDPHDHDRLAWCLAQLVDPARRAECAKAARETSQGWTFEHHYQALMGVFRTLVEQKATARRRAG
ncbi:MAG: glycosyltransferase family 4 protein [Gemmataceae bacterium]